MKIMDITKKLAEANYVLRLHRKDKALYGQIGCELPRDWNLYLDIYLKDKGENSFG